MMAVVPARRVAQPAAHFNEMDNIIFAHFLGKADGCWTHPFSECEVKPALESFVRGGDLAI